MNKQTYRYIYGPVPSWRLGSSLGIDPISRAKKACTFDCVYCQLGSVRPLTGERRIFVATDEMVKELKSLPAMNVDYVTFAGTGEPSLAKNLGEMIRAVREVRNEKIAVFTNSSMMDREDVLADLALADCVVAKLDAPSQNIFQTVNRPLGNVRIDSVIRAIKSFKCCYRGKLALQIMFIEENKLYAKEIARIAKEIDPDEVQLNTPLRSCGIAPLTIDEMVTLEKYFRGLCTVSVYRAKVKNVEPISSDDTLKRRGKV